MFFRQLAEDVSTNLSGEVSPSQCTGEVVKGGVIEDELAEIMKDKCLSQLCDLDLIKFYADNLYEYESGKSLPIVKGRLKAHVTFWESISAPLWILNTIKHGYVITFSSLPTSVHLPNNKSAMTNSSFVSEAISDLLKLGLIAEVSQTPTVVNPLSVAFNSQRSPRLILDLRHVNKCLPKPKFRMEDWKMFANYFVFNGFAFKFDMKSGYHHVDICLDHQQYLGFQWPLHSTKMRYFVFTVLPFGLSSAPYLFTKLFKPLVRHWRSRGFHIVLYLDDGAVCEPNRQIARSVSLSVRNDLSSAGVVPNSDKSVWEPVQTLEWLGILWQFAEGSIAIPQSRLNNFEIALKKFKADLPFVSPRLVASIVGKIISLAPVIGKVTLLMSRFLQTAVALSDHWDIVLDLSTFQFFEQCLKEIQFWENNFSLLNNRTLLQHKIPTVIIHSDASAYACGGHAYFIDRTELELYFNAFSSMEADLDSNSRELLAILYGLRSFRKHLKDCVVKFFTDNQNVAIICGKGSTSLRLHQFALDIFRFCIENNVTLQIEWIPRSLNEYADSISRVIDYDDWSTANEFYEHISAMHEPFTVDCFASQYTAKCSKFYSKFWCPGTFGVDAFSFDWSKDNNWLVPPLYLVPRAVFHVEHCQARGVLIVPSWKSALFWPVLFPSHGQRFSVKQVWEFADSHNVFGPPQRGVKTIFADGNFKSSVLAIVLDAS